MEHILEVAKRARDSRIELAAVDLAGAIAALSQNRTGPADLARAVWCIRNASRDLKYAAQLDFTLKGCP